MKYKQAIKESMEMLSKDDKTLFIGYGVKYGFGHMMKKIVKI